MSFADAADYRRAVIRNVVAFAMLLAAASGCASTRYVTVREVPRNPLEGTLQLVSRKGPQPTQRTEQLLRQYALTKEDADDQATVAMLQEEIRQEATPEKLYSLAEMAYIAGHKLEALQKRAEALDMYGISVAHSYWYLFDPRFDPFRNPYDPQFRGACDLYNTALEAALRLVQQQGSLQPGSTYEVKSAKQEFDIQVVLRGAWKDKDIDHLKFVSEYEMKGLTNWHHTYGLGVPLIAVRNHPEKGTPAEEYYPPGLSFAVTAFLRVDQSAADAAEYGPERPVQRRRCVLELHDPLECTDVEVNGRRAPLETDISIPLAYLLSNKAFIQTKDISTRGLLHPGEILANQGLFMLEPYDPDRIPVLMMHGLWSSPITWMEMFNDLRAYPEIRRRFQFWFYLYPTGQPFWVSATAVRQDLEKMRNALDPNGQSPAFHQMILVGHSMGGLVSRLQVMDSQDEFWKLVSDQPLEQLKAKDELRERLRQTLFFRSNPSIRRIVTIGTPHRGSDFANDYTQWLGQKLIQLPNMMVQASQTLLQDNPGYFRNSAIFTVKTSIDSLSPDCEFLAVMNRLPLAPNVKLHNIVGVLPQEGWLGSFSKEGDGVVGVTSARWPDPASEIFVPADHVNVHRHPKSILEVRRILLEHEMQYVAEQNAAANVETREARRDDATLPNR